MPLDDPLVDLHAVDSADATALSTLQGQCAHAPALRGVAVRVEAEQFGG